MAPKFIKTIVPEKETLGERLSKKRAALGFDIKEVERATKIRMKHLELIEAGKWDELPPDVYVRGFLKNYATFLHLDPNKVIKIYAKEKGLKESVKKITSAPVQNSKSRKIKSPTVIITPRRLIIGGAVLAALSVIFYIGWQISILAAPPKLTLVSPADEVKVEEDSVVVEGKTDAGADVFINDVPIGVTPDGNFKEKVSLQDGVNLIKVSAKNKLNKTSHLSRTVLAKLKTLTAAATVQPQVLEMKLDIGPNSASLYIEVDGKPLSEKNALMLPGSSQIIRANDKIIITASDGGSIRVNLNGKDLGLLGKTGEKIKNKEFNKGSI